jgi:hypothetical protein
MRRKKLILWAPVAIVGVTLFIALGGEIVQQLWNWLAPSLFGLRQISFWQAIGILALSRILFGGFGHGGFNGSGYRRRRGGMTPEERDRFREGIRGGCGSGPSPSESQGQ